MKLKELIRNQTEQVAFYCGIASNNLELLPLFDLSVLLKATKETLNERLLSREGTDDFGNTEAGRQKVLSWKDDFESEMSKAGTVVVSADSLAEEVAREIIKVTQ